MLRTYPKLLVVLLIFSTNIFSQTSCAEEYATASGLEKYLYFFSGSIIINDIERSMFIKDNINLQEFVLRIGCP